MENINTFKHALNFRWMKSDSGSSYICPADALNGIDNPSDHDLRNLCVDESNNPQNN